jgi:hypothetical protein
VIQIDIVEIYKHVIKFFKHHAIEISPEHKRYMRRVRNCLVRLFPRPEDQVRLEPYAPLILKLLLLDLEPVRAQLQKLYSEKPRGTPPRPPIQMLRSLLCMVLSQETLSFTKWVQKLRSQPLLALISGFQGRTPGVGTFYDFTARLYPETTSPIFRKPIEKPKDSDKNKPPRPGIIKQLVAKALARKDQPLAPYPARLLNLLLKPFVLRSAQLNILGDPRALVLSGDGTKLSTGACSSGRKLCSCSKQQKYRCHCPRKYSDRFATWGYDSYRKCYVFGHGSYELTAADSPYDLPFFILLAQAKDHDSLTAVKALDRALKLYPEFRLALFIGDSAHDNYPFYRLLESFSITPIIALNDRHSGHYKLDSGFTTDSSGVPLCPAGLRMVCGGFCPDRCRIKWRCPLSAQKASIPCACSPSPYGRVFYTKPDDDPRLFTQPPRQSKAWKSEYKKRTTVERSHKRKKIDYKLEQARVRSRRQWAVRIFLIAICQHADAWADQLHQLLA